VFTIHLHGDRGHPLIRLARKLRLHFPKLKEYLGVALWDGYQLVIYIHRDGKQILALHL